MDNLNLSTDDLMAIHTLLSQELYNVGWIDPERREDILQSAFDKVNEALVKRTIEDPDWEGQILEANSDWEDDGFVPRSRVRRKLGGGILGRIQSHIPEPPNPN